jgi:mercuric ion transport protein
MKERTQSRAQAVGLTAGIASAFAASICCIGPILAATFGLTTLGALVRYEFLRPLFASLSIVFLAIAFFLAYRKRNDTACKPGSVCELHGTDRVRRLNRAILWIAALVIAVMLTFPTWSNWIVR